MHQHCIDYGDIKPRVVEQPGHWRVVITRGFHHHTGLTIDVYKRQALVIVICKMPFKKDLLTKVK